MVTIIEERAEAEEIMNMMTIWSFAACSTEEPPRIAPVIIPGMAIIPSTLEEYEVNVERKLVVEKSRGRSERDAPHLVYGRRKS